jgi:hypothetical protein
MIATERREEKRLVVINRQNMGSPDGRSGWAAAALSA